jgi:hypothetical protein
MAINQDYYRYIKHALGDADPSPLLSYAEILKQAAGWLASAHQWHWLKRPLRLQLRGTIELSGATYTHATRTLTKTGAFATYTYLAGDLLEPTGGTGVTLAAAEIESRTDNDSVVLVAPGLGAAADLQTDIAGILPNDSMALPSDFLSMWGAEPLWARDSSTSRMRLVDGEMLTAHRTATVEVDASWPFMATVSERVDRSDGLTVPVLEHYPRSTVNQPDAFRGYYRARIVIDDTSETAVVPIPRNRPLFEACLIRVARIFALGYEEGDEGGQPTIEEQLEPFRASTFFRAAMREDSPQRTYGPLRGGVAQYGRSYTRGLATEVGGPS